MNTVNDATGNGAAGNGHRPDAALAATRPLLLVRYRSGLTGETGRTVHLVPVPEGGQPGALSALCGLVLRPEQVEQVNPNSAGAPCEHCALHHALTLPATECGAGASTPAALRGACPTEWDPQWRPVLLPPSVTPSGSLTWVQSPQANALRLTRESISAPRSAPL